MATKETTKETPRNISTKKLINRLRSSNCYTPVNAFYCQHLAHAHGYCSRYSLEACLDDVAAIYNLYHAEEKSMRTREDVEDKREKLKTLIHQHDVRTSHRYAIIMAYLLHTTRLLPWKSGELLTEECFASADDIEFDENPRFRDIISEYEEKILEGMKVMTEEEVVEQDKFEENVKLLSKKAFWNDDDVTREFLKKIKGCKGTEVTAEVSRLLRAGKISPMSCNNDLRKILTKIGYYKGSETTWNDQIRAAKNDASNPKRQ